MTKILDVAWTSIFLALTPITSTSAPSAMAAISLCHTPLSWPYSHLSACTTFPSNPISAISGMLQSNPTGKPEVGEQRTPANAVPRVQAQNTDNGRASSAHQCLWFPAFLPSNTIHHVHNLHSLWWLVTSRETRFSYCGSQSDKGIGQGLLLSQSRYVAWIKQWSPEIERLFVTMVSPSSSFMETAASIMLTMPWFFFHMNSHCVINISVHYLSHALLQSISQRQDIFVHQLLALRTGPELGQVTKSFVRQVNEWMTSLWTACIIVPSAYLHS